MRSGGPQAGARQLRQQNRDTLAGHRLSMFDRAQLVAHDRLLDRDAAALEPLRPEPSLVNIHLVAAPAAPTPHRSRPSHPFHKVVGTAGRSYQPMTYAEVRHNGARQRKTAQLTDERQPRIDDFTAVGLQLGQPL
jgi:hypothetical protein